MKKPKVTSEQMRLFDRLPKAIRLALIGLPYNYDMNDIMKVWKEKREYLTAKQMAEEIAYNAERQARKEALQRAIQLELDESE